MKASIQLKHLTVEVEGESVKDLFLATAQASEIFGEAKCGVCGTENIRTAVRTVTSGKKPFLFYEWHCMEPSCRAKLALGQNAEGGTLFPIRKLDDSGKPDRENGKYGKHNGWSKYRGEPKDA